VFQSAEKLAKKCNPHKKKGKGKGNRVRVAVLGGKEKRKEKPRDAARGASRLKKASSTPFSSRILQRIIGKGEIVLKFRARVRRP